MQLIKVASNSRTSLVAGAIAGVIRDNGYAEVQAIGAGALNQALKALIIAKTYLQGDGITVNFTPEFAVVMIQDKERTAIKLIVQRI